uniref:Putative secreted protein n=1 Tax=Anopheles marajoara TaxID=58244 RepID=A0A2M4C6G1_9DIPT
MHLVCAFCVVSARSSSSRALDFFIFFAKLLTAFSPHLPSAVSSDDTLRQPSSRFTIGGLKGSMMVVCGVGCCCWTVVEEWRNATGRWRGSDVLLRRWSCSTPFGVGVRHTAFLSFLSSFGGHTIAYTTHSPSTRPTGLLRVGR